MTAAPAATVAMLPAAHAHALGGIPVADYWGLLYIQDWADLAS
jgi:hypothetical protein